MNKMIAFIITLFVLAVGAPVGIAIWYTQQEVQHECQALRDLTAKAVPYPADPAANPSRVATYNFYVALLTWERQDGC
jgi:hypothetical protein